MTSNEIFKAVKSLTARGETPAALALLRAAIRRGALDEDGLGKAGRLISKAIGDNTAGVGTPLRVRLLGQCTTTWLVDAVTATAWGEGIAAAVGEADYDNVLQDLMASAGGRATPEVVVLIPWATRLLEGDGPTGARVDEVVSYWRESWVQAAGKFGAKIIQVGYDWVVPGPLGYCVAGQPGGPIDLVRRANAVLRSELPRDAYFVDLEAVSGTLGRDRFYDQRQYFWTKQPFSGPGVRLLAQHLLAGLRAVTTGPKKVLVLDLDNTLWGGVVGETGAHGISLGDDAAGEAFRAFQKHLKGLASRGVLLAVASKNNPADGREPFDVNADMILKADDVAAWEIGWEPKGQAMARIAATLNLGIDSLVFFDDNPAEREQVRQAQPEVGVADVPDDPAGFVSALQAGLWFEATGLTDEDRARTEQYVTERKRQDMQQSYASIDDYLRSLEMVAEVRPIDEDDLARVVQLLAKTNQFNLTTRRHSREAVLDLIGRPRAVHMTMRLRDRFGDHGLIAVLIAVPDEDEPNALRIDTWLMSCRVIARTVEQALFAVVLDRAASLGYDRILGAFLPTKKNKLVARLFDDLGFARSGPAAGDGEPVFYDLEVDGAGLPAYFVAVADDQPVSR
jgi:FkbH-like protein